MRVRLRGLSQSITKGVISPFIGVSLLLSPLPPTYEVSWPLNRAASHRVFSRRRRASRVYKGDLHIKKLWYENSSIFSRTVVAMSFEALNPKKLNCNSKP